MPSSRTLIIAARRLLMPLVLATTLILPGVANAKNSTQQSKINHFIQDMVKKHQFDKKTLTELFKQFKFQPKIIKLIKKPAESMTWVRYKPIFITDKRAQQGVAFWQKHHKTLAAAEQKYGVPAEIIVAIIGVETYYGNRTGGYRVLDALGTLAFGFPRRAKFFSRELAHFLVLTQQEKVDPLSIKGSYAGAMGIPQFMPSSYRSYAIDFDGDQSKDLWRNPADAIGSVANYFKKHGWKTGQDIAYPVKVTGKKVKQVLSRKIQLKYNLQQLAAHGVVIPKQLDQKRKGLLIDLTTKTGKSYWLGLRNFYVITRYNHSTLYGMAVYQLSQNIVQLKNKADKDKT